MSESSFRRHFLLGMAGAGTVAASGVTAAPGGPRPSRDSIYNVTAHGAVGDGKRMDTSAIQQSIDECARRGGGMVYFPAGTYLSGGLILKSHVHLYLEAGATLLGSKKLGDYPKTIPKIRSYTDNYTERSLIYAEDCANIGLHGDGVIDGQGAAFHSPHQEGGKVRPYLIRMVSCRRVSVSGVTLRNSPMWVQHYLACDDVVIRGIKVHSRVNNNNDGIDIDCCHRVTISDSNIWSGDDAIVLKSTSARPTKDVAITNCVISSRCNAFKLGTESNGGFENIVFSNSVIYDTNLSGLALEMVDGGVLDGVSVSNISMRNVKNPIFIRLGNRARPFEKGGAKPGVGKLRNVRISNVKATGASRTGCVIAGIPGHAVENVSIENVFIQSEGGVTSDEIPASVPEKENGYPEHKMFGTLPAYAFFCRHVRNIRFVNVETDTVTADARPAVVARDVRELEINSSVFAGQGPIVALYRTDDALIHGCRMKKPATVFLKVADGARGVSLIGNDLAKAAKPVEGGTVFQQANRMR